jgi:hypothetical protein
MLDRVNKTIAEGFDSTVFSGTDPDRGTINEVVRFHDRFITDAERAFIAANLNNLSQKTEIYNRAAFRMLFALGVKELKTEDVDEVAGKCLLNGVEKRLKALRTAARKSGTIPAGLKKAAMQKEVRKLYPTLTTDITKMKGYECLVAPPAAGSPSLVAAASSAASAAAGAVFSLFKGDGKGKGKGKK